MLYIIKETEIFSKWIFKLKDIRGKVSILRRIDRMKNGNFGDCKGLGDNISELRLTTGSAYRVYFTKKNNQIIVLLVAGDKSSQKDDIKKAKLLQKEYENA